MRDRFGSVRLLALVVYFAGLVFVLVTKNVRMQQLFNIAAGGLICFDSFVLSPPPGSAKRLFRAGWPRR